MTSNPSDKQRAATDRHRRACQAFGSVVRTATGRWASPSPCSEWDARGVLEHVIGFHDALVLVPFGAKPRRPKDDPAERWQMTEDAIFGVISLSDATTREVTVPAVGKMSETTMTLGPLIGALTTDVLIHTWDLARATDGDDALDPDLCEIAYRNGLDRASTLASSGMYAPALTLPEGAPLETRMLAVYGRDADWSASA